MKSAIAAVKCTNDDELSRTLSDESPVGICIMQDGKLCYVNSTVLIALGYTADELVGKHSLEIVAPEDKENVRDNTIKMIKGELSSPYQFRVIRKNGSVVWVMGMVKSIQYHGKPATLGNYMEIAERKQGMQAPRKSEERYRSILDEMEEGYYEVDLAGSFTFVNDAMCRILGYSRDELIGMNYRTYTPKEDVKRIFEAYNRVYRTRESLKWFPMVEIRKDGTRLLVEDSVLPITNGKGKVVGFRGISRDVTECKRMEEALRDSERKLRLISENSRDIICLHGPDERYVYVSPACKQILGYEPEELTGTNPWELVHPEDLDALQREGHEKALHGIPVLLSYRIRKKSGEYVWFESVSQVLRDHAGNVSGFVTSSRDITERKQAEEALRQSEEGYRTILEEMEDSYFEVDLGGHLTFLTNAMCRDLGYSREELMGKSYKDFTVQEDVESLFRAFNKVYRTGVPNKGFPWKTIRKDGVQGFVEASISPVRNDKGEIIRLRGVGRDITERKRAEEKLRQSEENYRTLFNSSVIGTIVLDAKTMRVVMANQAAAKMLGFSSIEEVSGTDPREFVHPEDRDEILEAAKKGLIDGNPQQTRNLRVITKDGREIWISATGARITHQGRSAGLISFADITEQKLQNDKLMITDRLASVGELAAGAAHELNNPLASIIGLSELLMEKNTPNYIRKDLSIIRDEARRAANVTSNLLTFARKHRPVKQVTQINAIIEEVLRLRAYAHRSNCIQVERHLTPDLPEMLIDPFQMQQVFLNIVINAEYFMMQAHNRGTLTITTERQDGSMRISFADDGPGIPPENLRRIFDPFFTTKEAGKGTGLGLSICHGIVAAHGGQIYARSQLGKGATICVELPIDGSNHMEVMP